MSFIDELSKKVYDTFSPKHKKAKEIPEEEIIPVDMDVKETFEQSVQNQALIENTPAENAEASEGSKKQTRKRNKKKRNNTETVETEDIPNAEEPKEENAQPAEEIKEDTEEETPSKETEEPAIEEPEKEISVSENSVKNEVEDGETKPILNEKVEESPAEIPQEPAENATEEKEEEPVNYSDLPSNAEVFSFNELPKTLDEMAKLPEISMDTPYKTAALTVLAYTAFEENPQESQKMFQTLCGSRALCESEWQILTKNIREDVSSIKNHFCGSVMGDKYVLDKPYTLGIMESDDSFEKEGFTVLYIVSGRNEKAGSVRLRLSNDGKWYFWDQELFG